MCGEQSCVRRNLMTAVEVKYLQPTLSRNCKQITGGRGFHAIIGSGLLVTCLSAISGGVHE